MSRAHRSDSDSSDTRVHIINNLSPRQLQHFQFSVPEKAEESTERFSLFLESPRNVPVPKRFTIDVSELERRQREENEKVKHARKESAKSGKSSKSSGSSMISVDLGKEVEKVAHVDWRSYATCLSLFILNLVAAWDVTTLTVTLPTIATALGGFTLDMSWLGTSSLVAATCFLPLFATFSGIFGRKAMILAAVTFFEIGSFIAAVTGNVTGILLGRTIQGISSGGIYVLSSLIVSDLVTPLERTMWKGILGAAWAIGAVTGPVIGGAVAQNGQWRWIFWLDLPFCTFALVVLACCARLKPAAPDMLCKIQKVDCVGFVLFSGSLVSTLLGLTWGGTVHPWSNYQTFLPIVVGLIGFLLFLTWSWFSPYPSFISLKGFLDPTRLVTYLGATIQGVIVFGALYFLPMYFSVARRSHSLIQTALSLCAWSIPLAVFALIAFIVVSRTNSLHRQLTWFAWFLIVLGVALMVTFTRESATVMWLCIAVFSGFGVGILYPTLSSFALSKAEGDSPVTNLVFFQTLGQTLGVGLGTAIFQNQLYIQLLRIPSIERIALKYATNAFALVNILRDMSGNEEALKTQVADAYVEALEVIWIVMAALAGVVMLASFFMKMPKDNRESDIEMNVV